MIGNTSGLRNYRVYSYVLAGFGIFAILASSASADFIVREVKSEAPVTSLAEADALLAGINETSEATEIMPYINMLAAPISGLSDGHFGSVLPFPNIAAGTNEFAVNATATVVIPAAGDYTFGVSTDDGSRVNIDTGSGLQAVITADGDQPGPTDHFGVVTFSAAGDYPLNLTYFQDQGEAEIELFAAPGSFGSFNSDFELVGDTANGGLATTSVPEPQTIGLVWVVLFVLLARWRFVRTHCRVGMNKWL